MNCHSHRRGGIYQVLEHSWVYRLLHDLVSSNTIRKKFLDRFVGTLEGKRVLDVGCGPAAILEVLPKSVDYTGLDLNPDYIRCAKHQYGSRARFECVDLRGWQPQSGGGYDRIFIFSLLHHLTNEDAKSLILSSLAQLAPQGRIISVDPVLAPGQHWFARWMILRDRGAAVRTPEGYQELIPVEADLKSIVVAHDLLRIPYSHCILDVRNHCCQT